MKEVFVNHSLAYLKKNNVCNEKQEKIFKYTLESLYSFVTKAIVILGLSCLFHTFKLTFFILLFYSLLRGFTFGIHATKNIYCWIISLTVYIIFPYLILRYQLPTPILYILNIIGVIAIILWAPADTKARPLLNKKKRLTNKIIALIYSLGLILFSFLGANSDIKEMVSIILLLNTLCINPLTYWLFKQPYRNYRFYKKINEV